MLEIISGPNRVRARKAHKCNWCGGEITAGEIYETGSCKNDGYLYTWKNHLKCRELVMALDMDGDDGISSSDFSEYIWEAWRETVDDDEFDSPDFVEPDIPEMCEIVYKSKGLS